MDEAALIEKLCLVEALFAGAATEGEKVAAGRARQRILERLRTLEEEDPPIEYRFSMGDMWSRRVFVALLRRYGIKPYRYRRQRYTTVMARVSKRFVDETLWPEFQELSESLHIYLSEVTERVVSRVIHPDSSEAEVLEKPVSLPFEAGDVGARDRGSTPPPERTSEPDLPVEPDRTDGAGKMGKSSSGTRSKRKRGKRKKRRRR